MLSIERQNAITQIISSNGSVKTDDLIKQFGVSTETIRRDLLALEKQGVLRRVYGGAIAVGGTIPLKNLGERLDNFKAQKHELAEIAAEYISDGDIIAIDEGSTAIELAHVLRDRFKNLTLATHCLDVLNILSKNPGINIILCGGVLVKEENSFYGELTAECFSKLHVMKSFIFPSALSLSGGIMDISDGFMRIQKKMIDIADEVFILADSSKFEKNALFSLCPLEPSFRYITDSLLSDSIAGLYEENGIRITRGDRK